MNKVSKSINRGEPPFALATSHTGLFAGTFTRMFFTGAFCVGTFTRMFFTGAFCATVFAVTFVSASVAFASPDEPACQERVVPGHPPIETDVGRVYRLPDWMPRPGSRIRPQPLLNVDEIDPGTRAPAWDNPLAPTGHRFDTDMLRQLYYSRENQCRTPSWDTADPRAGLSLPDAPFPTDDQTSQLIQRSSNSCNIVGDDDDRVRIMDTTKHPWASVVFLGIGWGEDLGAGMCTGILVDDNIVLSAGHCVFDVETARWAVSVIVVPALNYILEPFGQTYATWWWTPKGWSKYLDWNYDISLLTLAEPIGKSTGTVGYSAMSANNWNELEHTTAGYPFDWQNKLVTTTGSTTTLYSNIACSTIDVCSGQSGSGVWSEVSGESTVAAVVSGYGGECYPYSRVTRISDELFDWIQDTRATCECESGPCCDGCFLKKSGEICRDRADACDALEFCSGDSIDCPDDKLEPASFECRAAAGPCDTTEFCDGTRAACPRDAFAPVTSECRPATAPCDEPEFCDARGPACPVDKLYPKTHECRPAVAGCDAPEFCTGDVSACPVDRIHGAGYTCRAAAHPCDQPETCSGTSVACPDDSVFEAGHTCDDGDPETTDDQCQNSGECQGSTGCSATFGGSGHSSSAIVILFMLAALLILARRFGSGRSTVRGR